MKQVFSPMKKHFESEIQKQTKNGKDKKKEKRKEDVR